MMPADPAPQAGDVSEDAFLDGRIEMLQPTKGYRAGVDAVLLAAAAPVTSNPSERVLDAGAGVGVVGLCIAARVPAVRLTLAEIERPLAELARRNVARNGFGDRIDVVEVDLAAPAAAVAARGLADNAFAHIVANPPFHEEGRGRRPRDPGEAVARTMPPGILARWLRTLGRLAAPDGSLTLVHRADALPALLALLDGRFGALRLLPIHPREGKPAVRLLIQGRKGSRAPLALLPGLVLHGADSGFRPEVADILRRGAALPLSGGA